jgi:DNA-binding IclR family transcriptional regulator
VGILKILRGGVNRVTEISRRSDLSKPTIHRLLKSLEMTGLVMRDPEKRQYCLGPLVVSLSSDYLLTHQNLSICAHPDMQHLWKLSQETVSLVIQMGLNGIYLDEYVSPQPIRYVGGKGEITPLYTGSSGKVILSQLPEAKLKILLDNFTFERKGRNTILDRSTLIQEVRKAAEQGYAVSFEEKTSGGAAISVPIQNYVCPAAISIIGPDNRMKPRVKDLLKEMQASAEHISKKILTCYSFA